MKKYLVFIFLLFTNNVFSQTITLKILGQHSYIDQFEAYGVKITLEENPNKCDPIKGFISLEEQQKHLIESLEANGSKSNLIALKDFVYSDFRKKSFKIEETDSEIFENILTSCNNLQVKINEIYYKLPTHDFIEEDEKAIHALNDAKSKANTISNHLKYKVNKILSIDDDTSEASQLYELAGYNPELIETYKKLFESLTSTNYDSKESKSSSRMGKYNLWVTFELIPI